MADKTLTVNGQPFTFNRDRFAGVRTMKFGTLQDARTINTPSASEYTVTKTDDRNFRIVANSNSSTKYIDIHPTSFLGNYLITFDLVINSGSFSQFKFKITYLDEEEHSNFGSGSSPTGDLTLTQGSNAHSISVENDGVGQSPKMYFRIGGGTTFDVSINNLEIHKDGKVITVDRTAPVIDSDRAGASRPLLSKLVGGAAAAYSLRDLNDKAGNNKVVRVRRESDNNERDFLAKEVSNGTLQNWVNSQATLPLDLQTLTSEGRTGSVIGAQAAYSLRNLSKNYTGNVVEVRRSSDDTTRDFTADSITNGDLVAFCGSVNLTDTYTTTSNSEISAEFIDRSNFTLTYTDLPSAGNNKFFNIKNKLNNNNFGRGKYTVTFTATVTGNATVGVSRDGSSIGSTNTFTSSDGTASHSFTATSTSQDAGNFYFKLRSETGSDESGTVVITDFNLQQVFCNGHVKTWYDQSGNDNHATQGTAANQPKVVSNGSLIKDNDKVGIDFDDSSENFLVASSVSGMEEKLSVFSTSIRDSTGYPVSLSNSSSSSKYFGFQEAATFSHAIPRNTTSVTATSASVSGSTRLTFALTTGATSTSAGALGGAVVTTTTDYGDNFGSGDLDQISIGLLRTVSPSSSHYFDGRIREILVYAGSANGDQTDNRTALEANIAEHYGISGVPTATDTVNGFVEAWYDQSGNGRDVTQTTATEQPKIVSSGALVTATNNLPAIDFTTSVTRLARAEFLTGQLNTYFSIYQGEAGDSAETQVVFRQGANYRLSNVIQASGKVRSQMRDGGADSVNLDAGGDLATGSPLLQTTLIGARGANGLTIFVNGANETNGDTSDIEDTDFAAADSGNFAIGAIYNSDSFDFVGKGQEFIFYHSDQTLNRPAIEANIANQYGITLS